MEVRVIKVCGREGGRGGIEPMRGSGRGRGRGRGEMCWVW